MIDDDNSPSCAHEAPNTYPQQLVSFVTQAPFSIALFDRDMRYLATSQRWVVDYARSSSDLRGRVHDEVHPDLPERWKDVHRRGLAGETVSQDEDQWSLADGSTHWLRWSVMPWRDAQEVIGGIIISAENITARKQAEQSLRASEAVACQQPGYARDKLLNMGGESVVPAEIKLRESENRLNIAQRIGAIGSWEWDLATDLISGSRELYRLLCDDSANNDANVFAIINRAIHPDDRERILRIGQEIRAGGVFTPHEFRVTVPDGTVRWIASTGEAETDAQGNTIRLFGVLQDITERKHLEESLRDSEGKLRLVLDGLGPSLLVGLMTPDGIVLLANRPALAAAGLTPEDVVGKPVEETYWFSYSAAVQAQLRAAVAQAQRGDPARYDVPIRVADGVTIWIDLSLTPVLDAQGQVSFIVPSSSVIDERKKLEIKLAASEALLRTIVDSEPACVKLVDAHGKLLEMNKAGLDMVEADARELVIGKNLAQLVAPEHRDAFLQLQQRVIGGASGKLEFDVIGLKGTKRMLETHAVPLRDSSGLVIAALGLTADITERKRTEATNQRLEHQLQQAQKMEAIGQLTAGIAHDFNNILASVMGYAGLALEQHVPDKSSKLADYLREVQTAGTRARDLIANMLAFSRSGETRRQQVQIGPLAQEAAKTLAPTLPSSIAFLTRIQADGISVLADPVQLHQVIMNLVINARDAVDEHGCIELAVHLAYGVNAICGGCHGDVSGDFVELAIGDNGSGIPANILPHIFDPFYTTKAVGKGTGMGLSVVHGVVHRCGGHVSVNSSPDTGTVVRVLLPIAKAARALPATLPDTADPLRAGSGHILVVDDEDVLAQLFGEVLKAHGYEVTVFNDSLLALEQFHSKPTQFDAVVSDQTMPGLTGVELAQALQALRPALPIILCTGYSSALDRGVAERLGVALLSKPIAFETMLLTLEQMLAAARGKNVNI